MGRRPSGRDGDREVGENREEAEGVRFPYSPRRRRSVKGCPQRRAEVGDSGYGGGAARQRRGRAVGRAVVVAEGCAEALFIGRARHGEGGAHSGRPDDKHSGR